MKRQLKKNWWYLGIHGIAAIIVGLLALLLPETSTNLVLRILGATMFTGGAILIFSDLRNKNKNLSWGLWITQGIALALPGIILLAVPQFVVRFIFVLFGLWAIVAGIFHIITIFSLRDIFSNYIVSLFNGILMLAIGVLLISKPESIANTLMVFIGIYLLIYGIWQIYMAIRIKKELNNWQEPEILE